jgi:hypothetical protein
VPNAATLPQIKKWPLPSKSFPVQYSLMNVSFEAVQFEVPKVPLNEPTHSAGLSTFSQSFGFIEVVLNALLPHSAPADLLPFSQIS